LEALVEEEEQDAKSPTGRGKHHLQLLNLQQQDQIQKQLQQHVATTTKPSFRQEHLQKLLAEQIRQKEAGCFPNATMLREVSLKSSREARKRSAALGESDALGGYVSSTRAVTRQVQGFAHSISRKMQG